jgi:hypothetical protein
VSSARVTVDEETLARIVSPPSNNERCARCAHAQESHVDQRDGTTRGCYFKPQNPLSYQCSCDSFLLLYAHVWPGDRIFQVKTEGSDNWSIARSRKMLLPIDLHVSTLQWLMLGVLLSIAFLIGSAVGGAIAWSLM